MHMAGGQWGEGGSGKPRDEVWESSVALLLFLSRALHLHPHPVLAHFLVESVGCNS